MKTSSRKSTVSKTRKAPITAAKKAAPVRTANHEKAITDYEAALKAFSRKDYSRAISLFEAVIAEYPIEREVCDRSRTYISVGRARTASATPRLKEPDDYYYQAVLRVNEGRLDEASGLLEKLLKMAPDSDRGHYAMASICSLRNDRAGAVAGLAKAITLNPANRTMALNDADFDALRDDAEFMRLLGKAAEENA